jgi:pyrimidine operon attenuation protein/uracil phosphoribosyltransferase
MSQKTVILNAQEIEQSIGRIAQAVLQKHRGDDSLALVGIWTRGVYLARRLAKVLEAAGSPSFPCGAMDITLYRDDWTRLAYQPVLSSTEIPFSLDGRTVILVDDVLFTGRTIRSALDALIDFGRPDRIELAVLVDRGHRELPLCADFVGKKVETTRSQRVNVYLAETDAADEVLLEDPA